MAHIEARTLEIKKLCLEQGISPSAHAIAQSAGVSYELVRRMMLGAAPSDKTIAALMVLFDKPFADLFELVADKAVGQ